MKKIILLVFILIFTVNITATGNDDFNGGLEYKVTNIKVNSDDGQYLENVFSKYDSEFYEAKLKRRLTVDFNYQFNSGTINTELGLANGNNESAHLDRYLFDLQWQEKYGVTLGNDLTTGLNNYLLSSKSVSDIEGVIAEIKRGNFKVRPLYLRETEDLEEFDGKADIYGVDSVLTNGEELKAGASFVETVPLYPDTEEIEKQQNYIFSLDYQPWSWLEIDTDLGQSIVSDPSYVEQVAGSLSIWDFNFTFDSPVNAHFSYQQVHELYSPIRTTDYKEDYAFKETDYNQGYQVGVDYQLPANLKSTLQLEYSDFYRINSYTQVSPYVQDLGLTDKLVDDRIKTYQAGVVTEFGRWYSRAVYILETTTNQTDLEVRVDPNQPATSQEDLENEYGPGYKDKLNNVIHLYGRYNLLTGTNYSLGINSRYVWDRVDNEYHNYNSGLGSIIEENTVILGVTGDYQLAAQFKSGFEYSLEQKEIDFTVGGEKAGYAKGRLQKLGINTDYKMLANTNLKFDYKYRIYNLLDYTPTEEGDVYRYYDLNFNTHQVVVSLETRF